MLSPCLTIALLAAAQVAAVPPMQPVSKEFLNGRALTSSAENFSIEAPDGWSWFVGDVPDGHYYVCHGNGSRETFMLVTQSDGRIRMSESSAQRFLQGIASGVERQGARLTDVRLVRSTLGWADYKVSGLITTTDGERGHLQGYAGVRDRTYMVSGIGEDGPAGAARLESFLNSFHLLRPVSSFCATTIVATAADVLLVGLVMWLVSFAYRWSTEYRRLRWYVPVVGAMALFGIGAGWHSVLTGKIPPDRLDGFLGQVAGFSVVVAAALGIMAATQRRNDRQSQR